jgi:hypothetical protein
MVTTANSGTSVEPSAQVPYFSKWESRELADPITRGSRRARDDPRWAESGAVDPIEYELWSENCCGIACLRSVLLAWSGASPRMMDLARDLTACGAYVLRDHEIDGLFYAPFVEYVRNVWHINARVEPRLGINSLVASVEAGAWVMASVTSEIRDAPTPPEQQGGHLVLVYKLNRDQLVFHNSSGRIPATQEAVTMPVDEFARYFANKGVTLFGLDGS